MSDELTIERIISEIKEETGSIIVLSNEYKNFLEKYPVLDRYLLTQNPRWFQKAKKRQ